MRRLAGHVSVVTIFIAVAFAMVRPGIGAAQDVVDVTSHPLVGTWFIAEAQEPDDPFMVIFSSDGAAIQHDDSGGVSFGVWEATGPATANATFHTRFEEDGYKEIVIMRAAFEVAPDGLTLTGAYTAQVEMTEVEGVGELGPGSVTGTRMLVEPMGTPVAGFDEFVPEPEATPAG